MAYYNEDQLRRYFEKAIKRESENQIGKLQKEIDYLYNREIKKITEDIEIKKQVQMAKELKEVQINFQEELNQIGTGYDEKLIMKRREMTKSIFDAIELKLKDYMKTDAYQAWLEKRLDEHQGVLKDHKLYFIIQQGDQVAKTLITSLFSKSNIHIEESKNIQFGGFILTLPDQKIEVDETLDARLNEQKEWFINHSKLFIRR